MICGHALRWQWRGAELPEGGVVVQGERCKHGEVVAAAASDGSAASRQRGGHRKRLLEPHRALVIGRVKAAPDITLKALQPKWK